MKFLLPTLFIYSLLGSSAVFAQDWKNADPLGISRSGVQKNLLLPVQPAFLPLERDQLADGYSVAPEFMSNATWLSTYVEDGNGK